MARKNKERKILNDVLIEDFAAEGKSIAHIDGKVLFVPWTIPGDVVDVTVIRTKSSFMEGIVKLMARPSPDRITPVCDHYGECGGCRWQSVPYPLQLKFKRKQVIDQLTRIGHINLPEIPETLGSKNIFEYRNKLEFTFSDRRWLYDNERAEDLFDEPRILNPADYPDGFPDYLRKGYSMVNTRPEGFSLGFHKEGSFDKVLDIRHCHLQPEPSNEIRNWLKEYAIVNHLSFFNLREQVGYLRNVVIRNNSSGDVMVVLVFGPDASSDLSAPFSYPDASNRASALLFSLRQQFPQVKSLNYVLNDKRNDTINDLQVVNYAGEDAICQEMEGLKFKIGPKSFYQTNTEQAYALYSTVRDFCHFSGGERVYDLYTGTGTIALFVARQVSSVIGIEYVPEAIEDAKLNARMNGIENCDFLAGDMKDVLTEDFIVSHGGSPDVIILDPPRAGIHPDVADVILKAAPSRIVYVSCNPATQARDLAIFDVLYRVTAVQPVDMFPHTHHVENVVSLVKR